MCCPAAADCAGASARLPDILVGTLRGPTDLLRPRPVGAPVVLLLVDGAWVTACSHPSACVSDPTLPCAVSTGRRRGRPRAHGRQPPRLHEVLLRCAGRWSGRWAGVWGGGASRCAGRWSGRWAGVWVGAASQLLLPGTTAPAASPSPEPPPVRTGGRRHGWPRDDSWRPPVAGYDSHINDGSGGGRGSSVRGAGRRSLRWRCRPQDGAPSRGSSQPVWPWQRCRVVLLYAVSILIRAPCCPFCRKSE